MCFFPLPNGDINGLAYKKGVREFDCGACPECLRKRSNIWALRAVYEAKSHAHNCMVTLTYDNFVRDSRGNIIGETPVNPDLRVDKRDIQLFMKRLRKWWSTVSDEKIKYIACAEYGSRTHRAHYHLILFGVNFADAHFYKKSKRGNVIRMSNTLTKLWNNGICTVDSVNVHSAVARYCTKYCAKSRSDNTFMLCSQRIGLDNLMKDFNGISYFIDGREYPIPRVVWQEYISQKYSRFSSIVSPKYVNHNPALKDDISADDSAYYIARANRKRYRYLRDRDELYVKYLGYWCLKGQIFEHSKPLVAERIRSLDDRKFHFYKIAALDCLDRRRRGVPVPAPGSNCVSAFERWRFYNVNFLMSPLGRIIYKLSSCPVPPRPNRASDTDIPDWIKKVEKLSSYLLTFNCEQCMILV